MKNKKNKTNYKKNPMYFYSYTHSDSRCKL